jgi:hypothetical protein
MSLFARIASLLVLFVILASTVYACSVSVSNLSVEVGKDAYYYSSISANNNQDINVRISFDVDHYSGSDCPSNITAKVTVKRYNNNTDSWETYTNLSTKTQNLDETSYVFTWPRAFNTGSNSKYTEYKVRGSVWKSSEELDYDEATVDVENTSCSGINLVASDFSMNEGASVTKTLRVENDTGKDFRITNLDVILTNSLISSGSIDYDNTVSRYSSNPVTVSLDAGYVSSNQKTTITFAVEGYLDNKFCSQTSIGRELFDVTVKNTGTNDNSYYDSYYDSSYGTSADCNDIVLGSKNNTVDEATTTKPTITLQNNSTRRFEITEVKTTQNGVTLTPFYTEKYVFSGQITDLVLQETVPGVTRDTNYSNTIWVRGTFSNGKTCSFNNIPSATLNTTILNTIGTASPSCVGYSITAPTQVSVQEYGVIPIIINNNSNKRVDVFIEGTANTIPTLISLPDKTTISRDITVSLKTQIGEITFRPVIEGCSISPTKVLITNTSTTASAQGTNTGAGNGALAGLFALGNNIGTFGVLLLVLIVVIIVVGIVAGKGQAQPPQ